MKRKKELVRKTQNGMMPNFIKSVTVVFIVVYTLSCKQERVVDPAPAESPIECGTVMESFTIEVQPLLSASCGGCHGNGSANGPGALITYNQIFSARISIRSAVSS